MLASPQMIITLLAESIPNQSKSFLQYALVQTFLKLGTEVVRLKPIVFAWIRGKIGPNLTEKERSLPWLIFLPLCDAGEFKFSVIQAELILLYMILMVYSVMSPMMSWIMCFIFFLLSLVYRHQLFYIYPATNDTGGYMFPQFVKMVIICIYVAQLTLVGVLGLKMQPLAVTLLLPLVMGTVFFNVYINQRHFELAKYLPSTKSVQKDRKNQEIIDCHELNYGKYLQPSMQNRTIEPESFLEESTDSDKMSTA
mmetsp:Transcript_6130/g.13221  ORF Transcript_6130/g.13221 Transcript_6130/m.13221 type:complete len:253 (-) Transcript_6130:377-1135(-)